MRALVPLSPSPCAPAPAATGWQKHAALVGANIGQRLEDELLAWEVLHSLGLGDTSASVGAGSDDAGKRAWQQQPSQQREGGRDWGRGGPSERRS